MKKIINILVAGIFVVACSSNNSESTSTVLAETTTTTNVDNTALSSPTTTAAPISKSALPKKVNCPIQKISLETSEVFKDVIRCVDGWAVGIPQRFVEKFNGDTDVEAEWVLTNKPGKWTVVGVCHIYHPIYSSGQICNNPYNDNPIDLTLIPPMPVQCVLWDGANFDESLPETGCPKDS